LDRSYHGPLISGVIALLVWLVMKRAAKRRAQHEAEELGFAFPRVGGGPRDALREDAEREGWLL
jgi:hypothetical protein